MEELLKMFSGQSWFQIAGEMVLIFTALTGAIPDRWAARIPMLGKLWPIFNWLAGNVFNNINHPKGMEALEEVEAEIDKAKAKVKADKPSGIDDTLGRV
uniref:Uncharacterized protein n=1 Tax=uncultured marine virus TaxID=186617 RepID=A0A0F7L7C0_9VIRU|nr:hypothetical protein [uncultured marine virus]